MFKGREDGTVPFVLIFQNSQHVIKHLKGSIMERKRDLFVIEKKKIKPDFPQNGYFRPQKVFLNV